MNIQEVRAKFPQYNDLSDGELAGALHQKFYSDMPLDTFAKKIGISLADFIPGNTSAKPEKPSGGRSFNPIKNLVGDVETVAALGTGAAAAVVAPIAARIAHVTSGPAQTERGPTGGQPDDVEATTRGIQEYMTYRPRSQVAQDALTRLGEVAEALKIPGFWPVGTGASAVLAGPATRQAASVRLPDSPAPIQQPAMAGFGAAYSDVPTLRRERAAQLPVPIELTRGQATRDFAQQQFEREAAKNPTIGAPLRSRVDDQNQRILMNFDAWVDQTGAEAGSLRAAGQAVSDVIVEKSIKAKGEITRAYAQARQSGEMREPVNVAPLLDYLADKKPESINAPVLLSAEAKLTRLVKDDQISIGDLEEVRKMVGKLGEKDAPNAHFAREIKEVIDSITEGAGGDEYRRARALRTRYAKEFENVGVIDRLLSTKPGTSDRAVAYEDVFSHSILNGSLDDVRAVRRTLQTAGPKGEQAWKELQGQTIQYIKDEITKNVTTDSRGNKVVSPARLDRLVNELSKDGKLEFIFGKKGAQQLKDVNEIAKDAFTAVPGSVNHSNTASVLLAILDAAMVPFTGLPVPAASLTRYGVQKVRDNKLKRRVDDALK